MNPPVKETFSQEQFMNAASYSRQMGGIAVSVMQDGRIIFEDYHNGADQNTATHIQSGTKGFWGRDYLRIKHQKSPIHYR